jgi:hypothetical protein
MRQEYVPPEQAAAQTRSWGYRLMPIGAVVFGLGVVGILVAVVLKAVWLGVLGGPIASLSWLALIAGGACFLYGFSKAKAAKAS